MKPLPLVVLATVIPGGWAPIRAQSPPQSTGAKRTRWACYGHCSSSQTKEYDMAASNYSGDTVRGPRTIVAKNLNVLRYDYKFNSSVSFSQAPDLWSKLLGVSAESPPTAATPGSQTKPAPKNQATPGINAKSAAARSLLAPKAAAPKAPRAQPRPPAVKHSLEWPTVLALGDKARKTIQDASGPLEEADNLIDPRADASMKVELDEDTRDFNQQLEMADRATSDVALAGQNLVGLLKTNSATPGLVIQEIQSRLSTPPDSVFMKGVGATWADPTVVATLHRGARSRKTELEARKSKFDEAQPSKLAGLKVSERDLQAVLLELHSEADKLGAGARPEDDEVQKQLDLLNAAVEDVSRRLGEIGEVRTQLQRESKFFDWAIKSNDRILSAVPDLEQTSDKYKAFRAAQDGLISWRARMEDLKKRFDAQGAEAFSLSTPADCEFAFSRTKTTAVTLTRTDLLPGTTATGPETVLSVTVECTSPFAVSAGVAFSNIGEREFAIQPVATPNGSTTTTNEFVSITKSRFHPLPMGMIHARICEYGDLLSINAGFGVAGNFRSQTSGGSNAEFLLGPSLGLLRTMFITPGLHLGQKVHLGAGFQEGQQVPPNITTPPLQKSYVVGFGLAITFTKP